MREIPEEVARQEGVPEDLDSSAVGPYAFPSPIRRRAAAWVYLIAAAVAAVSVLWLGPGIWAVAAFLVALAGYHLMAAWDMKVNDRVALDTAGQQVSFAVGHAAAGVGFSGWRARPVWNVMVYSADEPPSRRALVQVDGVTGEVLTVTEEPLVQSVPPDRGRGQLRGGG
jgi:hypothetical protein